MKVTHDSRKFIKKFDPAVGVLHYTREVKVLAKNGLHCLYSYEYEGSWLHSLACFISEHPACWHTAALSTVLPRATFLLSITPVWISLSWFIVKPHLSRSLPKTKVGVNFKASLSGCSARAPTACSNKIQAGLPWALVSPSWFWAARGDVASSPESTTRVCPAMAAPRSPPHH